MIRLEVRADNEAARLLEAFPDFDREALEAWTLRGGEFVRGMMVRTIRERQRGPRRTGHLGASVRVDRVQGGFSVYPTVSYAPFVEDDTRPHVIRPRRAKALAFPRSGGQVGFRGGRKVTVFRFGGRTATAGLVFARGVRHPGTRGMHFARDTAAAVPEALADMLAAEKEAALRRAGDAARRSA